MSVNGITGQLSPSVTGDTVNGDESKPVSTPTKRSHDTNGTAGGINGPQQRAKRNRYIAIACNECKRRKIKCNGETPCQRCGNLSLECVYAPNCCSSAFKDSDEYRQINQQLQSLQEQVNTLYASLSDLHIKQQHAGSVAPEPAPPQAPPAMTPIDAQFTPYSSHQSSSPHRQQPDPSRVPPPPPQPTYTGGPTNSAFYLEQANVSLQRMGVARPEDANETVPNPVSTPKPVINPSSVDNADQPAIIKDPLWGLHIEEGMRLCRVYEDELWALCPVVDFDKVMLKARTMFSFLESMKRVGLMKQESERGDSFYDDDTMIFKMMLACAAVTEGRGKSELGAKLFENVRRIINGDDRMGKPATITSIQLLTLTAVYYFHSDDEIQSYRYIGIAARQCFELGLHRHEVLAELATTGDRYQEANRVFWIVYVLERRWSFGTGLPFAMPDDDIDMRLPEPDEGVPYLKVMVYYCKIASKVWTSVSGLENTGMAPKSNSISWLDYQISQWQQQMIPAELRFNPLDFSAVGTAEMSRTQQRLRLILYLRTNQLRIQLYRPVLYTVTSILETRGYATTAIELAKDTIRTLDEMAKTTDLYQTQVATFHYFLVSALTVLFIAVAHAPLEFARDVRAEFYTALELIKVMGCRSYIAKRLWKTIRNLKKVAPKLGLLSGQAIANANDPHSSAAVAMAGLAGHTIDANGNPQPQWANNTEVLGAAAAAGAGGAPADTAEPISGQQVFFELMNLFETACSYGDTMVGKHANFMLDGMDAANGDLNTGPDSFSGMWGDGDEFAKAFKDCL